MPELLDLVDLIPGDVLAQALVPVSAEADHDRDLGETAGDVAHQREELATVDLKAKPRDARVCRTGGVERRCGQAASLLRRPRPGFLPVAPCRLQRVETRRVLLLIADIGGYTSYMQSHRSMLGYAEAATTRLLKRVVDAARGFDLIEIEGDAAFLSRDAGALDDAAALAAINAAAVAMHRAFHAERRLVERNLCPCDSCTQTSELKLKFVAHVGEVATQTIKRRRKLVGMDVIFVHRLLKNVVPVPEYVLLSEDLYRSGSAAAPDHQVHAITLDLEGIGSVSTYFVEISELAGPVAPVPDPSGLRRLGVTLGMVGRGLPYALRVRRPPLVTR